MIDISWSGDRRLGASSLRFLPLCLNAGQINGLSHEIVAWDRFVRLVSLWEVLKTYAHLFAHINVQLSAWSISVAATDLSVKQTDPQAEFAVASIPRSRPRLREA